MIEAAKRAVRQKITDVFNDAEKGERPVLRRADALFPTDSVAWKVNGDVVTMMIGGVSGLLLQMLHPAVLAGVWDHSDFRADMHGRLRRTAKFIATTTYDHAEAGRAAIDRVNRIHSKLGGDLPDGTPYRVSDPELLAWVHVTETISFLDSWIRYAEPGMPRREQDGYFAEMARVGEALHADPLPRTRAEAEALIQTFRPRLRADARTHEVAAMVMRQTVGMPAVDLAAGVIMQAGMDLLPDWARAMHRQPRALPAPLVRGGALSTARLLRWAFDGSPNRRVHPKDVTSF
ncbi:MAG: oxygenase MpaB family protein [Brevundimonas sp.]|uniref:oxygenase MpaB family protein n=1 Tax=Brevundimonas sp. TaxID=1871086 RepID=UPI002AB9FD1F|nr:oxygenase MpaB family protein [Brevundimonas sp.]MDZ4113082.1 oxygenase MpaB family protein [Brevundimonas sp.]